MSTFGANRSALTRWPGRRPNTTPRFFAAAIPERTRSRSRSRSNSDERRHQGGDEFALRAAQIELQAGLGDERDVPRLQILQGVEQIEHRAAPAGQFSDEDDIDLAGLGEREDLLALGPVILGTGAGFLPNTDDFVAGLLGEGLEVALLTGTRLIGGRYPAIECGGLSQLNPRRQTPRKRVFSRGTVLVYSKFTSRGTAMPRRELLTEPQRLAFTEPAIEEREMVRHYTLSSEDLALIDRRRGDANRLGFAVLLCYLRFPGRTLRQDEQPPAPMLAFIAEQLSARTGKLRRLCRA